MVGRKHRIIAKAFAGHVLYVCHSPLSKKAGFRPSRPATSLYVLGLLGRSGQMALVQALIRFPSPPPALYNTSAQKGAAGFRFHSGGPS